MLRTISHVLAILNFFCLWGWLEAAYEAKRANDKFYIFYMFLAIITGLITSLLLTK